MSPFTQADFEPARKATRALSLLKSCLHAMDNAACLKVLGDLANDSVQLNNVTLSEEDLESIRGLLDYFGSREMSSLLSRRLVKRNPRPCLACTQQKVKVSD